MEEIIAVLLVFIVFASIIGVPVYFVDKHSCFKKTESYESGYGLFEGCYVLINGKKIPLQNFRYDDANT